jgi:long-chain acyl-CoA synthetase
MNLAYECLEKSVQRIPDRTAVVDGNTSAVYSYTHLNERVNALANALCSLGIEKGDRVALYLPNTPEFIIAFFANTKIGAISVPFNTMFKILELEYILNNCNAKCVIGAADQVAENILPFLDKLPSLDHIICVGELPESQGNDTIVGFDACLSDHSADFKAIDLRGDDPVSLLYTSGTTGKPKGALASHDNWVSMAALQAYQIVLMTDEDIILSGFPFSHVALALTVLPPFYVGAAVITLKRFFPGEALALMAKYNATHFMGTPTMWAYLLDEYQQNENAYDLSRLWLGESSGASLAAELCKRIQDCFGIGLVECYGATESSGTVTHTRFGHTLSGSVGWPSPGWEIKIMDNEGNELPNGEIGVLCCKGPGVVKEYWNDPNTTADKLGDGWWWSGDLAYIESGGHFDGQLYVVDREDDMIVCGGYNIYPAEVEAYLAEHPKVLQAFVVGIPDNVKGQIPKAFIVLERGEECTEEEIISFSKNVMAAYKAPRRAEFVTLDDLPQTASGKVLKRELRTMEASR